jgi:hypothetical protein
MVSAAERSLLRRVSVLTTEMERLEMLFALATEPDIVHLDLYSRLSGQLLRILCSLGLQRRPRVVSSTLADYIAEKQQIDADEQLVDDDAAGQDDVAAADGKP